jgi:hypothetical protein
VSDKWNTLLSGSPKIVYLFRWTFLLPVVSLHFSVNVIPDVTVHLLPNFGHLYKISVLTELFNDAVSTAEVL